MNICRKDACFRRQSWWLLAWAWLGLWGAIVPAMAQGGGLGCVGGLNLSVDESCEVWLTPELLLTTAVSDPSDFAIQIQAADGTPVPNPISTPWLDQPLTVTVTQLSSGNACWTTVTAHDALKPTLVACPVLEVACDVVPDTLPFPLAADNCDGEPTVTLELIQTLQPDLCAGTVELVRVFSATDFSGNVSDTCQQLIRVLYPPLPVFPPDVTWTCEAYQADPQVVAPAASGEVQVHAGGYCPYTVSWSDETIAQCGNTFRILRTWTVMDWCAGQVITSGQNGTDNTQLIKIVDNTPPQITPPAFELVADLQGANGCVSQGFVPPAVVTDCQQGVSIQVFTPVGELIYANGVDGSAGGQVPPPGLPLGTHPITWLAIDACGNVAAQTVEVEVHDLTPPVAVCDAVTEVTLSQDGTAQVPAAAFDDGSHDDCCIDHFEVRRLTDACGDSSSVAFGPDVVFCCADATAGMQTVVVRVYDCDGNFNDCMALVEVTDKMLPVVHSCPADTTITCDYYFDALDAPLQTGDLTVLLPFGFPDVEDNCLTGVAGATFSVDVDNCGAGTIERSWYITDPSGNGPVVCAQTIYVEHVSDFVVEFPADYVGQCGDTLPDTGEPVIIGASCELVAVSYEDQLFTVAPDACFKLERTWTVINWCVVGDVVDEETLEQPESVLGIDLDGDGDLDERTFQDSRTLNGVLDQDPDPDPWDGFITYRQIIKLTDTVAPLVVCPPEMNVCLYGNDCVDSIMIPLPDVVECSPTVSFAVTSEWGDGQGPWYDVEPGVYPVVYVVSDGCGNSSVCETVIRTADCKPPTPYCLNGLVVTLDNNQHAEAWAWFFNAGSVDNCSDHLVFSFSADTTDQYAEFECVHEGAEIIEMWVTDEAGNQDYCETILLIQDPNDYCPDALPSLAGAIRTEQGASVGQVVVTLSGDTLLHDTTAVDGQFAFAGLSPGGDYVLTPYRSGDWTNGVTTLDLVFITRHILGDDTLDTPYQHIAADANNSHSITTFDVVLLRQLILAKIDSLPGNTSWRFVPAAYAFDPDDMWNFPESIVVQNLTESIDTLDFVGIKVGDINHTANPELGSGSEVADRNALPVCTLVAMVEPAGADEVWLHLRLAETAPAVSALQFALSFDPAEWQFLETLDGVMQEAHLGLRDAGRGLVRASWNGTQPLWPDTRLFSVRFRKKAGGERPACALADQVMEGLAWDERLQPHVLVLEEEVQPEGATVVLPPVPNPFTEQTRFGCVLSEARKVSWQVLDGQGRVVRAFEGHLPAGRHEWTLGAQELEGPGVYVLVLTTGADELFVHKLAFLR